MSSSNKAFSLTGILGDTEYPVVQLISHTKYREVVELICQKYYNDTTIDNGEFSEIVRNKVAEHWPEIDTSVY